MNCDVCGESLALPSGGSLTGIMFQLMATTGDEANERSLKERIAPYQLDREYHVCWKCMMKAFGVKP